MTITQQTEKKFLPIGISSFADLRESNAYYVDKTSLITQLVNTSRFVFLSRPRRFGKSLTIDTIAELFSGNKELFTGLYAEDNWDWSQKHPVIRLSFGGEIVLSHVSKLEEHIFRQLRVNAQRLKVTLPDYKTPDVGFSFADLILYTQEKYNQKVVVLIDEYDKPILDNIDHSDIATEIRGILRSLYSQLKDSSASIRFAMLTGVSKFGQMSLFSGLNHIEDITLTRDYSALCGYTQEELLHEFALELKGANLDEVRQWYNGYNWLGESVYNPFDILLFFKNQHAYRPYWIQTGGNTSFLFKLIEQQQFNPLDITENVESSSSLLAHTDVGSLSPVPIMFQTGYLTIDEIKTDARGERYTLKFPNQEVRIAFNDGLWDCYIGGSSSKLQDKVIDAVTEGNVDKLQSALRSAFAGMPYHWFRKNDPNDMAKKEAFCASCFYMFFASCCTMVNSEDTSIQGRADLIVGEGDNIFIFEFKMKRHGSAQSALKQIKEKGYANPYRGKAKHIFEIGVSFDGDTHELEFAM